MSTATDPRTPAGRRRARRSPSCSAPPRAGRRAAALALLALVATATSACTLVTSPVLPYTGSAFHSTSQPVDIRFDRTSLGERRGTATSHSFLYLVAVGDASIMAAAREGGLSRVDHVESEVLGILGLYVRYRTIAIGR